MFTINIHLENDLIRLEKLIASDFDRLFKVASDPLIWEQHPSKERYKKEVFEIFFKAAIESETAFLVFDNQTQELIGTSRYYDYNLQESSVAIGYTFLARDHWGTFYNRALKKLMLDHAFKFVQTVIFHIGEDNTRSQMAIRKLGAEKCGEQEMEYYGQGKKLNYVYHIHCSSWLSKIAD